MLERIYMDVVHAAFQVVFVAACVFIKPSLPDSAFALFLATPGFNLFRSTCFTPVACELRLDQTPSSRIIRVSIGEIQHSVKVIGEQNNSRDPKGMSLLDMPNGLT